MDQQILGRPAGHGGEVGADVDPLVFGPMAGPADLLEDASAVLAITDQRQSGSISGNEGVPIDSRRVPEGLLRSDADRRIRMGQKLLPTGGIEVRRGDSLRLDGVEQRDETFGTGEEGLNGLAPDRGAQAFPAPQNRRRYPRVGQFGERLEGRELDVGRLSGLDALGDRREDSIDRAEAQQPNRLDPCGSRSIPSGGGLGALEDGAERRADRPIQDVPQ